jgi:ADP-ribose pyrophosphatase YjhB (NUDIX family)
VVAIKRRDCGAWALPGGMVDVGESVSVTVRREFAEEAGQHLADPVLHARFEQLSARLFSSGQVVYRGYVDDPRNTDNAWMETTAFHFHCDAEMGALLPLHAGDDAADVTWLDVDEAHYVCAILNAPLVARYLAASSDARSFKIRPPVNVPLYDARDPRHAALAALSRQAHGGVPVDDVLDAAYLAALAPSSNGVHVGRDGDDRGATVCREEGVAIGSEGLAIGGRPIFGEKEGSK